MDRIVDIQEAQAQLLNLMQRAHAGEEIIIAKAGKPYARLCPLEPPQKRPLGFLDVPISDAFFEPLPDDMLDLWE